MRQVGGGAPPAGAPNVQAGFLLTPISPCFHYSQKNQTESKASSQRVQEQCDTLAEDRQTGSKEPP